MSRLSKDESGLRRSVERGEWKSTARSGGRKKIRYVDAARTTIRKNRRINIRINEVDLEAIQKRALEEGIPYQVLVSSILHKFATGRIG